MEVLELATSIELSFSSEDDAPESGEVRPLVCCDSEHQGLREEDLDPEVLKDDTDGSFEGNFKVEPSLLQVLVLGRGTSRCTDPLGVVVSFACTEPLGDPRGVDVSFACTLRSTA